MRKYLLPAALILALSGLAAIGQTINKALQLSQDATGSFAVDSLNGIYFPGHILSPTSGAGVRPLPSITGTGTPSVTGTDSSGSITMGTSATTATVLFGTAYVSVPACVVVPLVSTPIQLTSFALATTSIAITQASNSANKYTYFCASPG